MNSHLRFALQLLPRVIRFLASPRARLVIDRLQDLGAAIFTAKTEAPPDVDAPPHDPPP